MSRANVDQDPIPDPEIADSSSHRSTGATGRDRVGARESGSGIVGRLGAAVAAGRKGGSSLGLLGVFLLLCLVILVTTPAFGNANNIANIFQQNSVIGIVACGMLVMIILGGFDLSVGAVGAMSSVVAAALIVHVSTAAGIVVALVAGTFVGLVNGFLIAVIGMSPFVVTLGTQTAVIGLVFVATEAKPVYGVPASFTQLGLGRIGPVPVAVLFFGAVVVLTWALLRYTTLGHYLYAVGGNREAAKLAGINTTAVIILGYCIGSFLAALAGIILLGQTGIGQPNSASTWALSAIAAVVIGGVPLTGGTGKVSAAVLGALLLGVITNALNLNGISPYWQPVVAGAVIILAVGFDSYRRTSRALS